MEAMKAKDTVRLGALRNAKVYHQPDLRTES